MRVRWPFLLALIALVLGLAAWAGIPAAVAAWRQHQDDRRAAAWVAHLTPAWRALSTMPDPDGLTGQALNRSRRFNTMFLWRGDLEPAAAALRFRGALEGLGATNAEVRCVAHRAQAFTLCRVDAVVAGVPITAHVGPALRPSGGLDRSSAEVGLDLGLAWPLSSGWATVPVR